MTTSPIATLAATETRLAASIHAAAATLDGIGTESIPAALARLQQSAAAARIRLAGAAMVVSEVVASVAEVMAGITASIEDALAQNHFTGMPTVAATASEAQQTTSEPVSVPEAAGGLVVRQEMEVQPVACEPESSFPDVPTVVDGSPMFDYTPEPVNRVGDLLGVGTGVGVDDSAMNGREKPAKKHKRK